MNIEEIYKDTLSAIIQLLQSVEQYLFDSKFVVYILIGIISFVIGNQKSDILISKKKKEKLEQFQNLKEQNEKSKVSLQKEQKKLSELTYKFAFLIIAVNLILYFFEIKLITIEIQIGMSLFLFMIQQAYKLYENYRLSTIKHNLEQTELETKKILSDIQNNLGENIIQHIQNEEIKKKMVVYQINLKNQFEEQYKNQIDDLKKKIRTLEDKEFQNQKDIHNFKRTIQTHKTEPIQKQIQNKNDDETQSLKQKIQYLLKESQIQKDMISKVINLEWCPDCIGLKIHCIELYFQKAKTIGEEYQQKIQDLDKENQVKN